MANNTGDWVQEQEELLIMDRASNQSEAGRLLEKTPTNRDITVEQGKLFTVARIFANTTGIKLYSDLADELEKVQMNVDDVARHDFMKVAIEQWQGKTQVKKEGIKAVI